MPAIQHKRRAVEQHVGLRGFEQFDQEAEQARGDGDVEDARDNCRGCVDELDVRFK
jgi:hypothetical protein